MALRYYDDAVIKKLLRWIPENQGLRVLKPDESKRLFEIIADDTGDKPFKLPFIALSRNTDIELLSNIKQNRSFDGLRLNNNTYDPQTGGYKLEDGSTILFNIIPVLPQYQLDIYTKTEEEADELLRNILFKLINNPAIYISIPYNGNNIMHIANIRVLPNVSDNSGINERIFSGQFYRWTLQLEIHDAFFFSVPYKPNWRIGETALEVSSKIDADGEIEEVYKFEK